MARRRPAPVERTLDCRAAWALLGVLCAFKILTLLLIVTLAQQTVDRSVVPVVVSTHLYWLAPLGLTLTVLPSGLWFRLLRARCRRRKLQYAEWHVA